MAPASVKKKIICFCTEMYLLYYRDSSFMLVMQNFTEVCQNSWFIFCKSWHQL